MFTKTDWIKFITFASLIMIATVVAYHEILNNDFINFDTQKYLIENTHIRALNWENFKWMWTTFEVGNWHPLTWFSHAIDYALFGLNPWGHHLMNLLFHGLNAGVFFGLALMLLKLSGLSGKVTETGFDFKTFLAAGTAALLFAIHPQHVESVAWESERKDVLCLFFTLLTLSFYLLYTLKPDQSKRSWYVAALFSFTLALLSKPMAVTVPIILILLDIYPLHRTRLTHSQQPVISYTKLFWEKVPFFGLTGLSIILTLLAQSSGEAIASLDFLSMPIRILNAFNTLIFYISKFLFPIGLSPFYAFQYENFFQPTIVIPVIASILITLLSVHFWYRRQQYYWLLSWLFYVVTLSPVIGIIQVGSQAAADRYTYLPTLPFYLLVGSGFATLWCWPFNRYRRVLQVGLFSGLIIIVAWLMNTTQHYSLVWRNKLTFWTYIILHNPDHALGQAQVCRIYFRAGNFTVALSHCQAALAAGYSLEGMYLNLLLIYLELGRATEAVATYDYMISHHLDFGEDGDFVHYHLAKIYFDRGEIVTAKEMLKKALDVDPNYAPAKQLQSEKITPP